MRVVLGAKSDNKKQHLLITALGIDARPSIYKFNENIYSARLSPIALMHLLPEQLRPHRIVALCTTKAEKETLPVLQQGVDIPVEPVSIPAGRDKGELWNILQIILGQIPAGSRVTLDLTQGFRSYPFLFFTAALFLKALRGVDVNAVYYGMFEAKLKTEDGQEVSPIVDLYPLLEMVEWFYATRMFRETGQAHLLSQRLSRFERPPQGAGREECQKYGMVKGLRSSIEKFALQYGQALPLELGLQAEELNKRLCNPMPEHLKSEMPVSEELFQVISDFIHPFISDNVAKPLKNKLELNQAELARQARVIDTYMDQGYTNYALGLIREWMVSVVMWHRGVAAPGSWLELNGKSGREAAERRLGAVRNLLKEHKDILSEGEMWLAQRWNTLSSLRNKLAHHGFRPEESLIRQSQLNEIKQLWEELKNSLELPAKWDVEIAGGRGTLLVSPLGLSKGLLFSALRHTNPDSLLVLTSRDAAYHIDDICARAGWVGEKLPNCIMEDPHSGFHEADDIAESVAEYLLKADKIVLNITGGTTALQYMAQKMGAKARQMDREVEQVALVDRRSPQEQKDDPFTLGELIKLGLSTEE
mgnify:CR=1 FL=1